VILGADVDACDWRVIRDGCRELPRGFPSAIEARPRVSLVINACGTRHAPNYFEHHPEITYLAKSRDDDAGGVDASIGADLDEMTQAIEDAVRSNRNVFVHCLEGRSRSAMVVIDWLRRFHGVSVDDALGMVQRARYSTASGTSPPKPNPAFLRVLRERESGVSDASGAGGAGGAGEPEASTADAAPLVPTIADVYGNKSIRVHLRALEQASAKSAIPAVRDVSDMFSEMGVLMFGARNEAELKTQVALINHVFPTEIMLEVRVPSDGAPLDKKAIWNALRALYIAAGIDG
jgi:hypothetical protein